MTTELPPSIADAEFPEEAGHPVFERALPVAPPPPVTKRPSKRRRPRKYRVAMKTDTVDSSMQVTRSGPKPAASDMARSHISQIPLREPQIIWVRSSTKIHPFKVTREYDNKKHRRFTVVRDGPPVSIKQAQDPTLQIPTNLHT